MIRSSLIFIISILLFACSSQRRLHKTYAGKPADILEKQFGKPRSIFTSSGDSVYVFEQNEELHSTEISQGKMTLDPIITPAVVKTQHYYFHVKNGIITEVRMDESYKQ